MGSEAGPQEDILKGLDLASPWLPTKVESSPMLSPGPLARPDVYLDDYDYKPTPPPELCVEPLAPLVAEGELEPCQALEVERDTVLQILQEKRELMQVSF